MRAPFRALSFSRTTPALAASFWMSGWMAVAAASFSVSACHTYQDDLARSQRAFEHADYERALAIFRALEPDMVSHFSLQEQAQYAYLRGMTDYRVGYKVDARHWLALAHAIDASRVGLLPNDWKGRMKETLGELNEQVYSLGIETLAESQEAAAKAGPAAAQKPKSEDEP
jgi:hypothetical protein